MYARLSLPIWIFACSSCAPPDASSTADSGAATATDDAPCTVQPRSGSAEGIADNYGQVTTFDLPQLLCTTVQDREGDVQGFRAAFGTYDPTSDYPAGAEPSLKVSTGYVSYDGDGLVDESATAELRLPGMEAITSSGVIQLDPVTHVGRFEGSRLEFDFSCDPQDDLSATQRPPAPEVPEPGTAIVTRGLRGDVYVMDRVTCERTDDRSLKLVRYDVGRACVFHRVVLSPTSDQPILGVGTYPGFFSFVSTLFLQFDLRLPENDATGTLDIQGTDPYRGFATFPGPGTAPDRVEFHCPE